MASEVSEIVDYREGRQNCLKRTFVSATDATRNKIRKAPPNLIETVQQQQGHHGKLVLFEHPSSHPFQVISEAAQKASLEVVLQRTGDSFELLIGGETLATSPAESEKKAKAVLGAKALDVLKESCFTVVVKSQLEGESMRKSDTEKVAEKKVDLVANESKGAKMMRMMGWTGKGLGKNADGIEEPIEATENISRLGLDLGTDLGYKILREKVTRMLEDYINNFATHNIVFSNEFSNEERRIVHGIAQKLKLKSKSYGKDPNRQLVVSRKLSSWELVEHLLKNNCTTPNYELIKPRKIS